MKKLFNNRINFVKYIHILYMMTFSLSKIVSYNTISFLKKTISLSAGILLINLFLLHDLQAQSPPSCTRTFNSGVAGTLIVPNGAVYCVPSTSTWQGSFLVRNGGHVIICQGNFVGSVTADPGGTLWDSPSTTYTGSVAAGIPGFGKRNRGFQYCCSNVNPGTISGGTTICYGASRTLTGNNASGGDGTAFSYLWQYRYSSNGGTTFSSWANAPGTRTSKNYSLPTTLAAGKYEFRRRATSCKSGYSNVQTVTIRPRAGTLSGTNTVCTGNTTNFTSNGNTGRKEIIIVIKN